MLSTGFSTAVDNLIPKLSGTNLQTEIVLRNARGSLI